MLAVAATTTLRRYRLTSASLGRRRKASKRRNVTNGSNPPAALEANCYRAPQVDEHFSSAGPTEPRSRRILGWVAGLVLGLIVVGPVLRPGALLNLDLVVTDVIPVPPSVWGLGPELPRRLPFFLPLAWLSTVVDGAFLVKVLMVVAITVAFRGMHRLCQDAAPAAALAASTLYAAGPFLATRLLTGHLGTALAMAILPWALPTLLHPAKDLRRTLLWSVALGCAGINGGIFALAAIAIGTVADRGQRAGHVFAAWLVGQLPWLVPGLVVMAGQDVHPSGAEGFDTQVPGLPGLLRLVTGQGFWLADFEVGAGDLVAPLVGALLVVLAIRGSRRLPPELGRRSMALAAVGLVIAIASAVPVVDQWYVDLASTPLGSALREGHRLLPLFLVWLAPAAAMGASSWGRGREVLPAVFLGASIALAGSAFFGFGGRLEPVRLPSEWEQARSAIVADPGTVVTLPWSQYLLPAVIDGHLVHNPAPFFLGGDVLLPSGRGDRRHTERVRGPASPIRARRRGRTPRRRRAAGPVPSRGPVAPRDRAGQPRGGAGTGRPRVGGGRPGRDGPPLPRSRPPEPGRGQRGKAGTRAGHPGSAGSRLGGHADHVAPSGRERLDARVELR